MARKKITRADMALNLPRDPYTDAVARLEPKALRALARELPKPDARYEAKQVSVDVYCAKRLYRPTWANPVLFRLVIDARGSYYRYGDYPPLDVYDRKSAVYLARVRYTARRGAVEVPMEEWCSTRFIPWRGAPHGFEDLRLCAHKGEPIDYWIQKKFPRHDGVHALISISRVCGICPYAERAGDDKIIGGAVRMRYTAFAFAAMNNEFFNVARAAICECTHVTTLMHAEIVARALTRSAGEHKVRLQFTAAHRTLGFAQPVRLARAGYAEAYCRKFPQYFLDVGALIAVLRRAVREKLISRETIAHYMGGAVTPEALLRYDGIHISQLRGLGTLLSSDGILHGATIDGEALRARMRDVPDGPALYMTERGSWESSVVKFCRALKFHRA